MNILYFENQWKMETKNYLKFNLINTKYYLLDMQGWNSALTILKPLS